MNRGNGQVMYLIFREDLAMSPGKIAAQAGHAVQYMVEAIDPIDSEHESDPENIDRYWRYYSWKGTGITKVALRVKDLAELEALRATLTEAGVWTRVVVDEGHTEVAPNSLTCMSIEPRTKLFMRPFVGHLKLL